MKEDFSQDEKNSLKTIQSDNSSSVKDETLDWAKQAYFQLKQKQKEEKEIRQKEIEETEILNTTNNVNEDFYSIYLFLCSIFVSLDFAFSLIRNRPFSPNLKNLHSQMKR